MAEHKDLPREKAMEEAENLAQAGWTVHFKFTCDKCGERVILSDPNILYEKGECCVCGYETTLDKVGFMVERAVK